jgi:hypothetical protein
MVAHELSNDETAKNGIKIRGLILLKNVAPKMRTRKGDSLDVGK